MNKREIAALRRSIIDEVIYHANKDLIIGDPSEMDMWNDGGSDKTWEGPEVGQQCRAIMESLKAWAKEEKKKKT